METKIRGRLKIKMFQLSNHFAGKCGDMGVHITATGMAVPPRVQHARELAPLINRTEQWIIERSGVVERRCIDPPCDPAVLAGEAAQVVLDKSGRPDCIIYCGTSVRQLIPDTSVFLQRELGLEGIPCFSVNAACLSFLASLNVAQCLIESGQYNKVLIAVAELGAVGRDFDEPESAALLGDGAAAVMLERSESDSGIKHFESKTWPNDAELAEVRGGGILRSSALGDQKEYDKFFHMQGDKLYRATLPRLYRFTNEFFSKIDLQKGDIDLVVPHQPSGPSMRVLEKLGFSPDRIVNILSCYGNCVSASMPMALAVADSEQRIKPGDHLLFLGTASGISIGAAVFKW